ncbi:chromosome-associated kinesin klp1 [Stylonychia lemnae]|uniref:Chromosome-associated kinesin klp1 n=1 Tax=Stylonychia lemnae TaxID=5949 RepID=A0A077ZYH8_STYLE|nr:chromosome-associated kinesin klp1 [Stylonychia lemnae]|eukprot:CDW74930.1 chromosome-associated kinesin klp1 [Stylonychia lemnae]
MDGGTTTIRNPETNEVKEFAFDYSYWSHDGFDEEANGYMRPSSDSNYADQDKVFQDLGIQVLDNAFDGYHTCLFAYGQTGSGKSYSIVGYGNNKGIIPRACEEIFRRIHEKEADPQNNIQHEVTLSMIEIYNECVQDLLIKPNQRPKGGLNVREHPKFGVYVENMSKVPVISYDEIQQQIDVGTNNRTIGSTNMNATSSRAHTITTLTFKQKFFDKESGKPLNEKLSEINLVDLAGSERAASTGAQGDRLKEGSNINKSLMILGKVISTLAAKSKGGPVVVPYRESKLTFILRNALGGNSKTAMIAALSPASVNYDETLSTLRYAWQVKSIKNEAKVNESPQEKLIRELKEENERLKKLAQMGGGGGVGGGVDPAMLEEFEQNKRMLDQIKQEREEYERRLKEKEAEQEVRQKEEEELRNKPHLKNINQDPIMSGKIKCVFKDGMNSVGKRDPNGEVALQLAGAGIVIKHCQIQYDDETRASYILPNEEDPQKNKTCVNGELLLEQVQLQHGDRVLIGSHHYFIYCDPDINPEEMIEWEDAMKEANKEQLMINETNNEEIQKQLKDMEEKLQKEREIKEKEYEEQRLKLMQEREQMEKDMLERQQQLLQSKNEETQKQMQEEMEKAKIEFQKKLKEQEDQLQRQQEEAATELERIQKKQIQDQQRVLQMREIDAKLAEIVPKIAEVNNICQELKRGDYYYEPAITTEVLNDGRKVSRVVCKVYPNRGNKDIFNILQFDKFDEVYFQIKDKYDNIMGDDVDETELLEELKNDNRESDGEVFGLSMDNDWQLIGFMYYFLVSVVNLVETKNDESPIIDNKGSIQGKMSYNVGLEIYEQDEKKQLNILKYNSLSDVIGKKLKLILDLKKAIDLPEKLTHEMQCRYQWLDEDKTQFETKVVDEKTRNPVFGYKNEHIIEIDEDLIGYMVENTLTIGVYGKVEPKKKQQKQDLSLNQSQQMSNQLQMIQEENEDEMNISPSKSRNEANMSKLSSQQNEKVIITPRGMQKNENSLNKDWEIEKLKREKQKLEEELNKIRSGQGSSPAMVQKAACCQIY